MLSAEKHIILNLLQLIHYNIEFILACKGRCDVLVLKSQTSTENFQEDFYQISMILKEGVLRKSSFSYPTEKATHSN